MAFVRTRHPGALRILLLEPGNRDEDLMVQRPLQMGLADHYTLVPLVSPDEMFHSAITELFAEWARTFGPHLQIGQLVGSRCRPAHRSERAELGRVASRALSFLLRNVQFPAFLRWAMCGMGL